jgi:elongation factor Ts
LVAGLGGAAAPDAVVQLAAKMGENCVLRRVTLVRGSGEHALLAVYTHNNVAPGQGSLGVVVSIVNTKGAIPPAARDAVLAAGRQVAKHIAAMRPLYVNRALVPAEALAKERAIFESQAAASGKPPAIIAKMAEGRLSKWYGESVLTDQAYALGEDGKKVSAVLADVSKAVGGGAQLVVEAFLAWGVGEGSQPAKAE